MAKILWLALASAFVGASAQARVFSYKDATMAAYVRGTGGLSQLAQDPFANEAGTGTKVDGSTKYNYGAEVGFAFALGSATRIRLGAEVIQENPVNGKGTDSTYGLERYSLTSSVFVFNPNISFEHIWSAAGPLRYYFVLGGGYANVTAYNDYKMTDAGTSALGVTDFKEGMVANTVSGHFALGLETLFTDNVTFMAEAGYRYLPVRTLKYSGNVTNFTGSHAKGDTVLNADGSKRTMNLGGVFVGVTFRFYLNFM